MNVWLILFAVSVILLAIILLRQPQALKWVTYTALNMVVAAALLYIFNGMKIVEGISIPINEWTLLTIGLLGVPGLFAIVVIKAVILP